MNCPRCRAPIREGQNYCERCGARLSPARSGEKGSRAGSGAARKNTGLLVLAAAAVLVLGACAGILGARLLSARSSTGEEPQSAALREETPVPAAETPIEAENSIEAELQIGTEAQLETGTEISPAPDYLRLYQPVLDAYREHERSGGGLCNWYGDEPGYVHVGISSLPRLGYMLEDLDGNGVPELILGGCYSEEDFAQNSWLTPGSYYTNLIVDLYTLVDGEPVYLVNSGDRYRYNLTDDGMLYYEGSSGAAYSNVHLYRVDGSVLSLVSGYCIDGSEDRCFQVLDDKDYLHEHDLPISYETFCQRVEELAVYREERARPLSLTPLS